VASQEAIQSAVAAYFGAVRAMDATAVADAFAPDGVSTDPVGTPPHAGRDAIRQFMHGVMAGSERVDSTADAVFIAGDSAAVKWTVHLTAKSGRAVTFEGIDVMQVNDQGKIQTLHAYWDPAPVLAVLQGEAG
jgi:steroid delta-isomerase